MSLTGRRKDNEINISSMYWMTIKLLYDMIYHGKY